MFGITFDKLRITQRGLSVQYQYEHSLRDQVLNACRGVEECSLALYKPALTFEGLCADLRSAIGTAVRTKEQNTFYQTQRTPEQYDHNWRETQRTPELYDHNWTDRMYEGHGRRYISNREFPQKEKLQGNTLYQRPRTNTKCYICKKPNCWSTRHPKEERTKAFARFREQLITEIGLPAEKLIQYLTDYEGASDEEETDPTNSGPTDLTNAQTNESDYPYEHYLTELGEIDGAKAVSALHDQCVVHIMTKQDVFKHLYDTEAFTFTDRYSSAKFQGIMPDSGAASISTAGEPQVLALQKQDSTVTVDCTTAGDHTIRFGKGTATAKGTVVVQTPLGPITFYVVPTNTPVPILYSRYGSYERQV
jgi:hypothetical protein